MSFLRAYGMMRPMRPDIRIEQGVPRYAGIALTDVAVVRSADDEAQALASLMGSDAIGFDTESKPTFIKGQQSDGPHLVQLATETKVFLFPVKSTVPLQLLTDILSSPHIVKVGFGLNDDVRRLHAKLGVATQNVLDLAKILRQEKSKDMGAKSAVAYYLGMQMQKSKKTSTSNWSAADLSEKQILYAANDAQVALLVYRKWLETRVQGRGSAES